MSRTLITLSIVGMFTVAWQLTGQETKTETNPVAKPKAVPALQDSPYKAFVESERKAEERILKALNKKISVEFNETSLDKVMEFIGTNLDIPILLDEAFITDEGIALDEPITFQAQGIAARSILAAMLSPIELTLRPRDEVLKITSETRAEQRSEMVFYDVTDLAGKTVRFQKRYVYPPDVEPPGTNFFNIADEPLEDTTGLFGGGCFTCVMAAHERRKRLERLKKRIEITTNQRELVPNLDHLIEVFQNCTSGPWEEVSGIGGTISEFVHQSSRRHLLAIRHRQEIHSEIELLLSDVRAGSENQAQKPQSLSLQYHKQLREVERNIQAALNRKLSLNFNATPLKDVAKSIGVALRVPVQIDEVALADDGISIDEPITFASNNTTVRSGLKRMLKQFDLCLNVRHEMLYVTSITEAQRVFTTKVYDVSEMINLVKEGDQQPTRVQFGGFRGHVLYLPAGTGFPVGNLQISDEANDLGNNVVPNNNPTPDGNATSNSKPSDEGKKTNSQKVVPDFAPLIDLIHTETTGSWGYFGTVGGQVREFEHVNNKKYYLVVRQTDQVHMEIEQLLHDLRRVINS